MSDEISDKIIDIIRCPFCKEPGRQEVNLGSFSIVDIICDNPNCKMRGSVILQQPIIWRESNAISHYKEQADLSEKYEKKKVMEFYKRVYKTLRISFRVKIGDKRKIYNVYIPCFLKELLDGGLFLSGVLSLRHSIIFLNKAKVNVRTILGTIYSSEFRKDLDKACKSKKVEWIEIHLFLSKGVFIKRKREMGDEEYEKGKEKIMRYNKLNPVDSLLLIGTIHEIIGKIIQKLSDYVKYGSEIT